VHKAAAAAGVHVTNAPEIDQADGRNSGIVKAGHGKVFMGGGRQSLANYLN